jgi:hypothetical protein
MPVEPTTDTLSLYTVYMCHHIKPKSVDAYLSEICQQLEPYFPEVQEIQKLRLVHRMLEGCKRLRGTSTNYKCALTIEDLKTVCTVYQPNLFALMCLGELCFPDNDTLWGCMNTKHPTSNKPQRIIERV